MKMILLVIESAGAALFTWYLLLATSTIQFHLGKWKVKSWIFKGNNEIVCAIPNLLLNGGGTQFI